MEQNPCCSQGCRGQNPGNGSSWGRGLIGAKIGLSVLILAQGLDDSHGGGWGQEPVQSCGRAGLHSPDLLQPGRTTMQACTDIMARARLRYKGTGLSHEVILISYALIHHSVCQPAVDLLFPACLRRDVPGRRAPLLPGGNRAVSCPYPSTPEPCDLPLRISLSIPMRLHPASGMGSASSKPGGC